MTSKERVKRALAGDGPDRAPRQLGLLPWTAEHYPRELAHIQRAYPDDIVHIGAAYRLPTIAEGSPYEIGSYTDDFGCVFTNIQRGIIGEVKTPIVSEEDWADADNVHIPEEWLSFEVGEVNAACAAVSDKFKLPGVCPRPFEQLQFIRGTENFYLDLMTRPPKMLAFMERLHDFYCRVLKKWAETDVDGLTFMDDWGSQNALLIRPALWRELFAPMYRDYIGIAHRAGKAAFMHSDGYILDILPDLADMGLDAVNAQLFCMGLDRLAPFRGKLTFWGEMDRQYKLVRDTPEAIEAAVGEVHAALWENGKCIAQCEFGPGARPENVEAVFRAWNNLTEGKTE